MVRNKWWLASLVSWALVFSMMPAVATHMIHLADILTDAIVEQFPEKFLAKEIDDAKQISFL